MTEDCVQAASDAAPRQRANHRIKSTRLMEGIFNPASSPFPAAKSAANAGGTVSGSELPRFRRLISVSVLPWGHIPAGEKRWLPALLGFSGITAEACLSQFGASVE